MPPRSHETPFERRERLNLEAAIARSSSGSADMTSQIVSGSTLPGLMFHPGVMIPNSQSDEESIQQFTTTIANSSTSSRLSPPTTVVSPIRSFTTNHSLAPGSREPGWSSDKFHHSNISMDNASSHLNSKSLHSSPQHSPKPIALAVTPSASNPSSHSNPAILKPLSPHLQAARAACTQQLEPHKSTELAPNLDISPTTDPSLQKSKPPPENLQNMPNQLSVPEIEILSADQPITICKPPSLVKSGARDPPFKKRKKSKSQQESGQDSIAEVGLGVSKSSLKLDEDGKRVRKQSAVGKASAKSLEILLNLSPPSKEQGHQQPTTKDQVLDGPKKSQRRPVFRDGWALVPDSDTELSPNRHPGILAGIPNQELEACSEPSVEAVCPPPEILPPITKSKASQSFLEITSSPLTSPSGFSADEKSVQARKKPKSSTAKKPGPKKKGTTKLKTKKARKGEHNSPVPHPNNNVSPVGTHKCSQAALPEESTNAPSALVENSEARLDALTKLEKENPKTAESITHPSPVIIPQEEKVMLKEPVPINKGMKTSKNPSKTPDASSSGSGKLTAQPNQPSQDLNSTNDIGKSESNKLHHKRPTKGLSLAEILASTNPKTKRGLRIGLPKEEKHRLHMNINPKPVVQKQVKKKLKAKRGEYDSGEDDQRLESNSSGSAEEEDKPSGKQLMGSKLYPSQEGTEADDDNQDVKDKVDLEDEEYE